MKSFHLDDMIKGWFVGDFSPAAFSTKDCEVAVKKYKAGDYEGAHHHKVATEITVVVSGKIRMVGKNWGAGDIVVVEPGTVTDFEALTDVVNVVVKVPGATDDKYLNG
jgi:quercetin dioxygenase-like cupin family protein